MKRKARPICKPRQAPPCAGTAWSSWLLTFLLLIILAGVGHILGVYQPISRGEWRGIHIVPISATPVLTPPLPDYQPPTEQSTPDIPFTPPQLVAHMIEMPDISTSSEEPLAEAPLIDFPESLHAPISSTRKATRPNPSRTLASKTPVASQVATKALPTAEITTPPAYKSAPPPPYPAEMRASRTRGVVRVRIAVNPEGIPTAVQITSSSGHRLFDTTATRWILRYWRFNPATCSGVPVASSVSTRVEFILDNA